MTIRNHLKSEVLSWYTSLPSLTGDGSLSENEVERRKAVTDEQAKKIIEKVSGCSNVTEFQNIDSTNKPKMIQKIYKKGVSIRQIIRLTGTSKYNVEKFIK